MREIGFFSGFLFISFYKFVDLSLIIWVVNSYFYFTAPQKSIFQKKRYMFVFLYQTGLKIKNFKEKFMKNSLILAVGLGVSALSSAATIAVIDSGWNTQHDMIESKLWFNQWR